ncbi:enoyl-CoA hydratase [Chloroflexota bacterium]
MAYSTIIYEKKGNIARITLNRPEVLNAMSYVMQDEISQAVDEIAKDEEIGVLILTGAGRGFCAGRDLKEALRFDQGRPTAVGVMEKIHSLPIPTICAVNGHCVTGGLELAISCDIIIASEKAIFADTHARAGLVPGGGMSQILPLLIGPNRAKEMSFTGRFVPAQEAFQMGLVNKVVPHDQLLSAAEETAQDILGCNQKALQIGKSLIEKGMSSTLEAGLVLERMTNIRWRDSQRQQAPEEAERTRQRLLQKTRGQSK